MTTAVATRALQIHISGVPMLQTSKRAIVLSLICFTLGGDSCLAREPDLMINVWPKRAPGETTSSVGETLPQRPQEMPPSTRVKNITQPRLAMYKPAKPNGTSILVLPGGAYKYVVIDKEGSEVADWLNPLGVTVFVLHYRTKDGSGRPPWQRPLQDGQRAIRLLRRRAAEYQIESERLGVAGFSAGGHAAALLATRFEQAASAVTDDIDRGSCRPDFAILIYPAYLTDGVGSLRPEVTVGPDAPPTFLLHAHNDASIHSTMFYKALRDNGVAGELHIYQAGGHGFGLRPVKGSNIHTWTDRAADWMQQRGLITK